jgi:hypothetical protein
MHFENDRLRARSGKIMFKTLFGYYSKHGNRKFTFSFVVDRKYCNTGQ